MQHQHLLPLAVLLLCSSTRATQQVTLQPSSDGRTLFDSSGNLLRESNDPIEDAKVLRLDDATRIAMWQERTGNARPVSHFRIALPGQAYSRVRSTSFEIELLHSRFDPLLEDAPSFDESQLVGGGNVHIVQFVTQSLATFRNGIKALGGDVVRFLPRHAHLVRMTPEVRATVAQLPYVRWIGEYHPEYRMAPETLAQLESGALGAPSAYMIQVLERGLKDKEAVAARVVALGGEVTRIFPEGLFLYAKLDGVQLAQVLRMDEVLFIDPQGEVTMYMDKVRIDGGADYLENQTGYTGQGVRAEVMDSGFLLSHQDMQSPPAIIHGENGPNIDHGTSVAGIAFGDGSGNAAARGILPDAQPILAAISSISGATNRYTHTAQLLESPYNCVLQSNSWGMGVGTGYNNNSTEIDDILFQYDITILQAQANTGSQFSDFYAWGKNVVSVGAIFHFDTQTLNDDSWFGAASIGPAADGRIKPDLSFWMESIFTTGASGGYKGNFGGTSAATPATGGYFGLFYQMWHENVFGTNPGGATVFESRPKATLAKAVIINGADQYAFSGGGDDLKRVHQGWGRADVARMYDLRDKMFFINETEVLTNLQSVSYPLEVLAGQDQFRATLVYLDPAGTTSAALHRINDLSLRVTSPSGVLYWGNNGLRTAMYSSVGGNSNEKDTVENVWVENPEAGTWIVEVIADEIVADSHVETPADDADFALVVSGIVVAGCGTPMPFCTTSPNSVGSGGLMGWSGSSSIAANDFVLSASAVPANRPGIFFYGAGQTSTPFGNGNICIGGGAFYRLPITSSNGAGVATTVLDITSPPHPSGQIVAGSTWNFQYWYRDPAGGGAGFNLTDGLDVEFCN